MNRFMQFMDALEEGASGLIRIAYLLAGALAVAAYFSNGVVPQGVVAVSNAVLPWILAGALELHSYISARRVRSAWLGMQASSKGSEEHRKAVAGLRVNLVILTGLLVFSMLNQAMYLASTWVPAQSELALLVWLAYSVRAVVVLLAFMGAAFLAPTAASLSSQIQQEAHRFAGETFKVARVQWKKRLTKMQTEDRDVTAALVQLVDDPAERRVIEMIHGAMFDDARPTGGISSLPAVTADPTTTQLSLPPAAGPDPTMKKPRPKREPVLTFVNPDKPVRKRRSPKERVYNVLARSPEASIQEIAKRAKCAPSTAVKHRKTWLAEHETEPLAV